MYRILFANGHISSQDFDTIEEADKVASLNWGLNVEVVQVKTVRTYPRHFTEEQRKALLDKTNLREYASMHICGDGLELDLAESELFLMTDVDLVVYGILNSTDEWVDEPKDGEEGTLAMIKDALKDFPELVEPVTAAVKAQCTIQPEDYKQEGDDAQDS